MRTVGKFIKYKWDCANVLTYSGLVSRQCADLAKVLDILCYKPKMSCLVGLKQTDSHYLNFFDSGKDISKVSFQKLDELKI